MRRFNFLFSLTAPFENWQYAADIPTPDYVAGFELTGEHLDSEHLPRFIEARKSRVAGVADIVPRTFFEKSFANGETQVLEFLRVIDNTLAKAEAAGAAYASLDLGFASASVVADPKCWDSRGAVLQRVAASCVRAKRKIRLSHLLKATDIDSAEAISTIPRQSMGHHVGIILDVAPHRISKDVSPRSVLMPAVFDMDCLRISYEPESGEFLTHEIVENWLGQLAALPYFGPVAIAPQVKSFSVFESVVADFIDIIESPRNGVSYCGGQKS